LTKISIFRTGFLPRNPAVSGLSMKSGKTHRWSTTSWKNQPALSGNDLQQRSSLGAPNGAYIPSPEAHYLSLNIVSIIISIVHPKKGWYVGIF
jgi:hypothetical protein